MAAAAATPTITLNSCLCGGGYLFVYLTEEELNMGRGWPLLRSSFSTIFFT